MTTCEKATELIVKNSEIKPSFSERLTLKFHVIFCKACKLFETQNKLIDQALSTKDILKENVTLSTSKKEKLEELIKKESNIY